MKKILTKKSFDLIISFMLLLIVTLFSSCNITQSTNNIESSNYGPNPSTICYVRMNEKVEDIEGNYFIITGYEIEQKNIILYGEFNYQNFVNFSFIEGVNGMNVIKLDFVSTSIMNNYDFTQKSISYNGNLNLYFNFDELNYENSIEFYLGINKPYSTYTYFVIDKI